MAQDESGLKETQRRYLETIRLYLRPNTVLNARTGINAFIRYLECEHPGLVSFSALQRSHIEGWLQHLADRPLRRSTRRNLIIKVRVFLEAIREWGWEEAPGVALFRRGDMPPEDRCLPRPLSEDVDRALQEELRRRGGLIHMSLLLMRATGLRTQELLDLKLDDLKGLPGDQWALHVPVGKLHSERVIPVDAETAELFEAIREIRGSAPPATDPATGKRAHFLLARPNGRRFSRDAFRYHLGKMEKEARLREHPTPHRLRHTFATEMLRAGMNLPVLMKLLGHRRIDMTLRYAAITGHDVRRAYLKTIEALKGRYKIPSPPSPLEPSPETSTQEAIVSHIQSLAAEMEAHRRDRAKDPEKKRIQRFVERLRRLAADFRDLTT